MKVALKQIYGPWDIGWVLDKHVVSSTCLGDDEYGHPRFNTLRTEVGEATFQLKYRGDLNRAKPLAQSIAMHICPMLSNIGFIMPMPASKVRDCQPVTEVAREVGTLINVPVFDNLLVKACSGISLKDIKTKEEKIEAIGNSLSVVDMIDGQGRWNVLVIDDLFDTGASMEMACHALRKYSKVAKIYVAALTWK